MNRAKETPKSSNSLFRSVILFFGETKPLLSQDELRSSFRLLSTGIFVNETILPRLLETYDKWLQLKTGSQGQPDPARMKRKLFGSDDPELQYVIEGNSCFAGYVVPTGRDGLEKLKLPRYQGSPLAAKSYLHPRDPKIAKLSNVKLVSSSSTPVLQVQLASGVVLLPLLHLPEIVTAIRDSGAFRKLGVSRATSARDLIQPLVRLLELSKPVEQGQSVLVRERDKRGSVSLRRIGRLLLMINASDELVGAVDFGIGRQRTFILEELHALGEGQRESYLRGARLEGKRSPYLLRFRLKHQNYKLHIRAVMELLQSLDPAQGRRRPVRGRRGRGSNRKKELRTSGLPGRYSIGDVLKYLLQSFRSARRGEGERVITFGKKRQLMRSEYRDSRELRFQIVDGRIIYSARPAPGRRSAAAVGAKQP